jgi:uncharacterized protein YlxP (DUF503 family)
MNIGICKLQLHLPGNQSLKDKRRIVKSIISRLQNHYNVSVAEVDDNELWQLATLGISCVSNSSHHVDETITAIINFITHNYPELEIVNQETEIIQGS